MAPSVPKWFDEALQREFRGELRIRWSERNREWHIEQKVGRGIFDPPRRFDPYDDRQVRARDGYSLVMKVQPSPRRACPECFLPMEVPQLRYAETRCDYCGYKGLSGRAVRAYFPLGEKLLQHLRSIDPTKDTIRKRVAAVDLHNQRRELGQERDAAAESQDYLRDWVSTNSFAVAGLPGKVADAPWNN